MVVPTKISPDSAAPSAPPRAPSSEPIAIPLPREVDRLDFSPPRVKRPRHGLGNSPVAGLRVAGGLPERSAAPAAPSSPPGGVGALLLCAHARQTEMDRLQGRVAFLERALEEEQRKGVGLQADRDALREAIRVDRRRYVAAVGDAEARSIELEARCRGLEAENRRMQGQFRRMQMTFIHSRVALSGEEEARAAVADEDPTSPLDLVCEEDSGSL